MGLGTIIEMLMMLLRGYLLKSEKLAPFTKWLLRIRDYLNLLFPIDTYPEDATGDVYLERVKDDIVPVPISAVKTAAKKEGFNIPFIKGM